MAKANVYLFQINYTVTIGGRDSLWLPYSVGCLSAYAKSKKDITDYFEFGPELFCRRESPEDILERLDNPAVCGFSNYVWNTEWNLHVSKIIKEKYPECVIIFGGPNVWQDMDKDYDHIDVFLKLEGEFAFVDILRKIRDGEELPKTLSGERIHELEELKDPYETGEFDYLVKKYDTFVWNATYESNRGCPFLCSFCDWGGLTYSKVKKFSLDRVENNLKWMSENKVAYILCADANVGIFKDRDIEMAKIVRKYADMPHSLIDAVNFQYNKNNTNVCMEIAEILGPYGRGITFAVQSMDHGVLEAIQRKNMDINKFENLLLEANKKNLYSYTELILPMPLETMETWKDGLSQVIDAGQHQTLMIWNTQILRNSEMNNPEYREKYGLDIIETLDYINYQNPLDWHGAPEKMHLVRATDTMTLEETIECWVYSNLIREFHHNGVTQMISRYLNGKHGLSYRKFYDTLFEVLKEDDIMKHPIDFFTQVESHFLTTGVMPEIEDLEINFEIPVIYGSDKGKLPPGHFVKDLLNAVIHNNLDYLKNLVLDVVENKLGYNIPDGVKEFNNVYMYDENVEYPSNITLDFNIIDKIDEETTYKVTPRILEADEKFKYKDDVLKYKTGLFKSKIELINT